MELHGEFQISDLELGLEFHGELQISDLELSGKLWSSDLELRGELRSSDLELRGDLLGIPPENPWESENPRPWESENPRSKGLYKRPMCQNSPGGLATPRNRAETLISSQIRKSRVSQKGRL